MKIVQQFWSPLYDMDFIFVHIELCRVKSHGPMNWIISFVQWIQLLYSNWNDIRRIFEKQETIRKL